MIDYILQILMDLYYNLSVIFCDNIIPELWLNIFKIKAAIKACLLQFYQFYKRVVYVTYVTFFAYCADPSFDIGQCHKDLIIKNFYFFKDDWEKNNVKNQLLLSFKVIDYLGELIINNDTYFADKYNYNNNYLKFKYLNNHINHIYDSAGIEFEKDLNEKFSIYFQGNKIHNPFLHGNLTIFSIGYNLMKTHLIYDIWLDRLPPYSLKLFYLLKMLQYIFLFITSLILIPLIIIALNIAGFLMLFFIFIYYINSILIVEKIYLISNSLTYNYILGFFFITAKDLTFDYKTFFWNYSIFTSNIIFFILLFYFIIYLMTNLLHFFIFLFFNVNANINWHNKYFLNLSVKKNSKFIYYFWKIPVDSFKIFNLILRWNFYILHKLANFYYHIYYWLCWLVFISFIITALPFIIIYLYIEKRVWYEKLINSFIFKKIYYFLFELKSPVKDDKNDLTVMREIFIYSLIIFRAFIMYILLIQLITLLLLYWITIYHIYRIITDK